MKETEEEKSQIQRKPTTFGENQTNGTTTTLLAYPKFLNIIISLPLLIMNK